MLNPPAVAAWYEDNVPLIEIGILISLPLRPTLLVNLLQLMNVAETAVQISEPPADDNEISAIDHEEQTAGYQAAYTKLAASETSTVDPVAYVPDAVTFMRQQLASASTLR